MRRLPPEARMSEGVAVPPARVVLLCQVRVGRVSGRLLLMRSARCDRMLRACMRTPDRSARVGCLLARRDEGVVCRLGGTLWREGVRQECRVSWRVQQ